MGWIRVHPFASILALAGLIVIAGAIFVESHVPVAPTPSASAWSGSGVSYPATETEASAAPQQIVQEVIGNQAPANVPLPGIVISTGTSEAPVSPSGSFDYVSLLSQIVASSSTPAPETQNTGSAEINEAYEFIPQGFVAGTSSAEVRMTADQQALYDYGNQVGGVIQAFERENSNEAQVLKDQAEDRTDPTKNAALVSLGQDLAGVGAQMQEIQEVPASIAPFNSALAQSYQDIGAKLQLVASAQSDSDFVQAIQNYDSAANAFVSNYGALAAYLSAQGVVFQQNDPGSVFSFSQTSGEL